MSLSNYLEDKWLKSLQGQSFVLANGSTYVKLHKANPGELGTLGAADETARKACTWAAPVGNAMVNASPITWTNVGYSETYNNISLWDTAGPTGGNCLGYGALSSGKQVTAGDNATFDAGSITFTVE